MFPVTLVVLFFEGMVYWYDWNTGNKKLIKLFYMALQKQ